MNYSIRAAVATDVKAIFDLIVALAAYQELSHLMTGNSQALGDHLFGEKPYIEALVAEVEGKKIAIVGDILHSRVARSNIWSLTTEDFEEEESEV